MSKEDAQREEEKARRIAHLMARGSANPEDSLSHVVGLVGAVKAVVTMVRELTNQNQAGQGEEQQQKAEKALGLYEPLLTTQLKDLALLSKRLSSSPPSSPLSPFPPPSSPSAPQSPAEALGRCGLEVTTLLSRFIRDAFPADPAPQELVTLFHLSQALLLQIQEILRRLPDRLVHVEQDLLPVAGTVKELLGAWNASSILQSLLADQKAQIVTQLQKVVVEAKRITAGDSDARIPLVFSLVSLGEIIRAWVGAHYGLDLTPTLLSVQNEKRKVVDYLQNPNFEVSKAEEPEEPEEGGAEGMEGESAHYPRGPRKSRDLRVSMVVREIQADNPSSPQSASSSSASSSLPTLSVPSGSSISSLGSSSPAPSSPRLPPSSFVPLSPAPSSIYADPPPPERPHIEEPLSDYEKFMKMRQQAEEPVKENNVSKKLYFNAETLNRWRGKFFARSRADFNPGSAHGDLALNFEKGTLIVVYEDDGDLWQGVNPETEKFGYFPKGLVEQIANSFKREDGVEEKPSKPLNEAVFRKEQEEKARKEKEEEERRRREEEEKKGLKVVTELSASMMVKSPKKKWDSCEVILRGFNLVYSKKIESSKDTKTLVSINLPACVAIPASEKEVGKEYFGLAFKLTEKNDSVETFFACETRQECTDWVAAITLATLSLNKEDLSTPDRYEFGNGSARAKGLRLSGFDANGNTFTPKEKKRDSKSIPNSPRTPTELTPEEIEKYSSILPSKTMIEKMANTKKRSSLFKAFKS